MNLNIFKKYHIDFYININNSIIVNSILNNTLNYEKIYNIFIHN